MMKETEGSDGRTDENTIRRIMTKILGEEAATRRTDGRILISPFTFPDRGC